jgi:hypothetical protein
VKGLPPLSARARPSRHDETRGVGLRFRHIGSIMADFKFVLAKESRFSPDARIVQTFVEFHNLIFELNVTRPAELKIEMA